MQDKKPRLLILLSIQRLDPEPSNSAFSSIYNMLEQLLDQIHCYPVASGLRRLKKSFARKKTTRRQTEWIRQFESELTISESILQCKSNLEEEKRTVLLNRSSIVEQKMTSDLDRELEQHNTKIAKLNKAYWEHRQALVPLIQRKPKVPYIREWDMERLRKRGGMTLMWWAESVTCVLRGGCCTRACGCCEKPRRTYMEPNSRKSGSKKDLKYSYAHCTSECRCCIQSRGCKMPSTNFANFMDKKYGGI